MIIYLIGFMGAGKTTHGKVLAGLLKYSFIDLDVLIEEKEGRTIPDIFASNGEGYFRQLETSYLKDLEAGNTVVSVGGGTPCFNNNMEWMNNHGLSVYLKLSAEILTSRLTASKTDRPLLKGKTKSQILKYIKETLSVREGFYEQSKIIIEAKNLKTSQLYEVISQVR